MSVINFIQHLASSTKHDDRQLYEAIRLLDADLAKALRRVTTLEGAPVIDTGGANFSIKQVFLDDDKTIQVPSEIAPALFLYVFTHDATSNIYTVTWPDPPFARLGQPFQGANVVTLIYAYKFPSGLIVPAQGRFGGFPTVTTTSSTTTTTT